LIIAKDTDGHFYIPSRNFNNMADMREGWGYYMRLDEDDVLIYQRQRRDDAPECSGLPAHAEASFSTPVHKAGFINQTAIEPVHLPVLASTEQNMSLLVSSEPGISGEIGVYANGQLVGTGVLQDGVCGIAIWGDDPSTTSKEGAGKDETLEIRLVDENGEHNIRYTVIEGDLKYTTNSILVISINGIETVPDEFGITSIYPNPFNSKAAIRYNLTEAGAIQLNIYDLTGRLVRNLVNKKLNAGSHSMMLDGSDLTSGFYFVKLEAMSKTSVMKVILVK
ncbi:MAG: T9SS type A sorting domain-containing protein, partial [Candidatus Hatepunaea meridiana]|nr:T9SS type A sorting domain-containing protein [Candidatus Hatepunaea meridiana]